MGAQIWGSGGPGFVGSGPGDWGLENTGSRAHVNVHKATLKNWLYVLGSRI